MLTQTQAALVLNGLANIGPVATQKLRRAFDGDLCAALNANLKTLIDSGIKNQLADHIAHWQNYFDLKKEEEKIAALNAHFIAFEDVRYPQTLRERPEIAPIGFYLRGNVHALETVDKHSIAFIGTRKSTLYGNNQATHFAEELAARGWTIVSGLAEGIDAAAHRGALNTNGTTIAVLGTGIDIYYPAKNRALFEQIIESDGAIISEFSIGRKADKLTFPQRNRIVAAISQGTFVVESDIKGGSMITANFALNYNKPIFALPGRIDVPASAGCHQLIRDGAILVTRPEDIIHELDGFGATGTLCFDFEEKTEMLVSKKAEKAAAISADAGTVFKLLSDGEKLTIDELIDKSQLPMPNIMAATMLLELEQLIIKYADGRYEIN